MKFDISQYDDTYAMHCKTEADANHFLSVLNDLGLKWNGGESYLGKNNYSAYKDQTCYLFLDGTYSNLDYFLSEGSYTVLEFDDFDWGQYSQCELNPEDATVFDAFMSGFKIMQLGECIG